MVSMLKYFLSTILFTTLISCAGPTSPFGANIFFGQEIAIDFETFNPSTVDISSYPDKQYYNSPFHLTLSIRDPHFKPESFKYEILYNNQKLKRLIKSETIHFPSKVNEPIKIEFNNLSILPGHINNISFLYYSSMNKKPFKYDLEIPDCIKEFTQGDFQTNPFQISNKYKQNIHHLSEAYGYNPSLIAALIAQESSFNPKALSYAYALGLTQITPRAAIEINKLMPEWNIYPNFENIPVSTIKKYLANYQINQVNDWRLNPQKSIEGGLIYFDHIQNYWNRSDATKLLKSVFKNNIPYTDIILASYNSGPYRVKKTIRKQNKNWLLSKNLKEARKYVMNIKSYCYSFENGVKNEN